MQTQDNSSVADSEMQSEERAFMKKDRTSRAAPQIWPELGMSLSWYDLHRLLVGRKATKLVNWMEQMPALAIWCRPPQE